LVGRKKGEVMINIQLSYLQLLGCIALVITTFKLLKILIVIIFSSKPVLKWNLKRQQEKQKLIKKTQKEQMLENLQNLAKFMEEVDKRLPNRDSKKQFWKEFVNKQTRDYWMQYFMKQFEEKKEDKNETHN